ncbi:response regulator [Planctomycetota bacterium]
MRSKTDKNRYQESRYGNCPVCGKTDGYVNISCNHWFVCHEHKTKWFVGSGLFSSWENEREIDWLGNAVLLGRYEDVEPIDSKQLMPVSPVQKEEMSYQDLHKQLDRRRILVIDDEPTILESCKRIFAERDFDVETAASAKEGLERAMRGYFDCALIDLKLPDMDGMEIIRNTREKRSSMPVLIITGYGTDDSAAEASRLGVSAYINKPFTPEQLVEAVENAIQDMSQKGTQMLEGRSHLPPHAQTEIEHT